MAEAALDVVAEGIARQSNTERETVGVEAIVGADGRTPGGGLNAGLVLGVHIDRGGLQLGGGIGPLGFQAGQDGLKTAVTGLCPSATKAERRFTGVSEGCGKAVDLGGDRAVLLSADREISIQIEVAAEDAGLEQVALHCGTILSCHGIDVGDRITTALSTVVLFFADEIAAQSNTDGGTGRCAHRQGEGIGNRIDLAVDGCRVLGVHQHGEVFGFARLIEIAVSNQGLAGAQHGVEALGSTTSQSEGFGTNRGSDGHGNGLGINAAAAGALHLDVAGAFNAARLCTANTEALQLGELVADQGVVGQR